MTAATAITFLTVACIASVGDGILWGIVAYERDTTVYYYPLLTWAADQLHQTRQLPLWSPNLFGGYPIFADGELGLASPFVRLALNTLPVDRAFILLRVFHLCVAALGCYALARSWRLPHPAAALAGLTFALGSFFASQIHHENIVRSGAWLPGIIALVERTMRSTGPTRWRWGLGASAGVGFAALGLHPQVLVIDLFTLAAYGVLRCGLGPIKSTLSGWTGRVRTITSIVPVVMLLGLLLAAVQLLPFVELVGFSARGQGIPYAEAASYSLTPTGLMQMLFPFFFRGQGNIQWGLWTHWEAYLYVGVAPLVLALVAVVSVRRREIGIWVVLGAIGLLLALGQYSPLNLDYLLWLTPGLGGLRAPGRWSLVVVLSLAMLAAYGLAWLQRQGRGHEPRNRGVGWLVATLIALAGVLVPTLVLTHDALLGDPQAAQDLITTSYLEMPHDTYPLQAADVLQGLIWSTSLSNPDVWGPLCALLAMALLLLIWQMAPLASVRRWQGWPILLLIVTFADLLSFGWRVHPREPLATLSAPQPSALAIQQLLAESPSGPYRVLTSPVMNEVAPNRLAPYGLEEASGYSSLEMPRQSDLLKRIFSVDDGLLDVWNIRYLLEPAQYGALADYAGVDYLAGQALLSAPAGGTLGDLTFRVPPGFRVQHIRVIFAVLNGSSVAQSTPVAELTLKPTAGTTGSVRDLVAGQGTVFGQIGDGAQRRELRYMSVDLAPAIAADGLRIRAILPSGELVVYGVALVDPDGAISQVFGHRQTKYREVYRDALIAVLENSAAYPRAFFVPWARIAPSGQTTLDVMTTQAFSPSSEVVLPSDAPAEAAKGTAQQLDASASQALASVRVANPDRVRIEEYAPGRVVVRVSTTRNGFVVLSDTFYPGWQAFVDGREEKLLRGDMLFQVVPVTAGDHLLTFQFRPSSFAMGVVISMLAEVVLIACACWLLLRET